jgi:CRISPR-associated protein Cmr6
MRKALSNLKQGQHPGLLLQKYAADLEPEARQKLMQSVIAASACPSVNQLYGQAYLRWIKSFPVDNFHLSFPAATTNRLIIGLGTANVLEAGIRLHQTYGIPIIPGSALKGLAAHYCHEVWGKESQNENADEETKKFRNDGVYHRILFGDTDESGRGTIVFHDAWIQPESLKGALRMDVMTPHHQDWQTKKQAPTDFDSRFRFLFCLFSGLFNAIFPGRPMDHSPEEIRQWLKLAQALLIDALSEWGLERKPAADMEGLFTGIIAQAECIWNKAETGFL